MSVNVPVDISNNKIMFIEFACFGSKCFVIRGSQNLKVGHVTQATLPCDVIGIF